MKATGIVRRIDDLGRVVVPKEIRRTLRIREGDPMEIYTAREGEVILKKYSPMGELENYADAFVKAMSQITGFTFLITDRDQTIAAAGKRKNEYLNKNVSRQIEELMEERSVLNSDVDRPVPVYENEDISSVSQIIYPIICSGDVVGTVIAICGDDEKKELIKEYKIVKIAATFLGNHMEA